jgi:hypothetical protein
MMVLKELTVYKGLVVSLVHKVYKDDLVCRVQQERKVHKELVVP